MFLRKFKPNGAAMLCYVLPFVLLFAGGLFSAIPVLFLLAIGLSVGFQIFLLKAENYKKIPLIRFHAYQPIFLVSGYYLCNFLLPILLMATSNGSNFFQMLEYAQFFLLVYFGLFLAYLGLTNFYVGHGTSKSNF